MKTLAKLISALTLISTCCIAAEETPDDIDWYQVEVLIFSQQDLFNDERHVTDLELSYPENIRELVDPSVATKLASAHTLSKGIETAPLTKNPATTEQPFLILPKNALSMSPDHTRLNRAPGYRTLYHQAWRQPGLDKTESPWILIKGGNVFGNHHELEGSFRLVRNRYLHIQTNLWKTTFKTPEISSINNTLSENTTLPNNTRQTQTNPWPRLPDTPYEQGIEDSDKTSIESSFENNRANFEPEYPIADIVALEQSTRVFRGKLTYLDHPNMGVIILVSKYKLSE
tara:strand:- start:17417 stop:18274 length:858 start_codon:yes stop_codon:yes gene_type:complete